MAEIKVVAQTIEVSEVGGLDLTEVEGSETDGLFTRELRVYALAPSGGRGPLVASYRLTSAVRAAILIKTPETAF